MSYEIICPFCFKKMKDDEVHFRSELVNQGDCDIIPDDYDDVEDFISRYNGEDKEEILIKYRDWDFFTETEDQEYEAFWQDFNGTTEFDPADKHLKTKAYRRKVIDPSSHEHQKYIKKQNEVDYFIRDEQGMVTQIELITGDTCNRRVCRYCHNPLPDNYGKYGVKFATIVGITGAGKTVYLSQLLKRMKAYSTKVGLTAVVNNTAARTFLEKNSINAGESLPGSTPATRFQQPLFYELVRDAKEHGRVTETFVLYDVAGEVFKSPALVNKFAPFIRHADGVIVLIDPMQFEVINGVATTSHKLDEPSAVLDAIQNIVSHGKKKEKCNIPCAICMSKADTKEVQYVLTDELRSVLLDDVRGVLDEDGFSKPIFNAKEYAPIGRGLREFIMTNEAVLAQQMQTNYTSYAYFAFTALGCDVEEGIQNNGERYQYPVGPILPKRVEEPMLWLFYKLGYIGKNGPLPGEILCPNCNESGRSFELPEEERIMVEKRGLFKKVEVYVDRCCSACGHKWDSRNKR